MKKIVLVLMLSISLNAISQSTIKDEVSIVQDIYGKSKTEIVMSYMNLQSEDAATFSSIYGAYEVERKVLGEKKIQLINDYATNFTKLTEENADQLAKGSLENNLMYDKLHLKYYNKLKKAIGAINAAKFIQLEVYLQTAIRGVIQENIPFIGEIEKTKK